MKHEKIHGPSRSALTIKTLIGGVAAAALLGLSINAQAQTCVVSNWTSATGLADADAGTQGGSNRRYGGPCGLRVPGGGAAYVTDETPSAEGSYIARFYAYLNDAGAGQATIFEATDGTDPRIEVVYDGAAASGGDLILNVYDSGGAVPQPLSFTGIGTGWHSIELVWEAAASADIRFSVNGAADVSTTVDTSGTSIVDASLGNVDGGATGAMDFDDFDSRRISRPGRLEVGDANADDSVSAGDLGSLLGEINEVAFAPGQPDCTEDGSVNAGDLGCILGIINS